jgi:hypothetical protein
MKTAYLLLILMMIGRSALMDWRIFAIPHASSYVQSVGATPPNVSKNVPHDVQQTAPSDDGKRQTDGNPSDKQRHVRNVSEDNLPGGHSSTTKSNRPRPLSSDVRRSKLGNSTNGHQPSLANPNGATNAKLIQNHEAGPVFSARHPSVVSSNTSSSNKTRHRSPNPAIVGGSGNAKNTGALDGTRMSRNP